MNNKYTKDILIYLKGTLEDNIETLSNPNYIIRDLSNAKHILIPTDSGNLLSLAYTNLFPEETLLLQSQQPHKGLIKQYGFTPQSMLFDDEGELFNNKKERTQLIETLTDNQISHFIIAKAHSLEDIHKRLAHYLFIQAYTPQTGIEQNAELTKYQ